MHSCKRIKAVTQPSRGELGSLSCFPWIPEAPLAAATMSKGVCAHLCVHVCACMHCASV